MVACTICRVLRGTVRVSACKMSRTERGHLHQVCFTHTHNHTHSLSLTHAQHSLEVAGRASVHGMGQAVEWGTESVFITFTCKICCMFVAAMVRVTEPLRGVLV